MCVMAEFLCVVTEFLCVMAEFLCVGWLSSYVWDD